MVELQMMIDNWKQEADELSAQVKGAAISFNMSIQLSSKAERLRKCIADAELLISRMENNDTPPQLHKHDVIRSAIGDDNYNSLSRLIQLHEMLNNGQGLDDEQYDEHEQLVSDLDNILPLH